MRKMILYFIPYFCFFASCSKHNSGFYRMNVKLKIDSDFDMNTALIGSGEVYYMGGSIDKVEHIEDFNQFAILKSRAVVYYTQKGFKNWIKKDLGEGQIINLIEVKNLIFAIKENSDFTKDTYLKNGNNWDKMDQIPKNLRFLFHVGEQYIAICDNQGTSIIYSSKDLHHWDQYQSDFIYRAASTFDQRILIQTFDSVLERPIVKILYKDSTCVITGFSKNYDNELIYSNQNKIFFCGTDSNQLKIYNYLDNKVELFFEKSFEDKIIIPYQISYVDEKLCIVYGLKLNKKIINL